MKPPRDPAVAEAERVSYATAHGSGYTVRRTISRGGPVGFLR
jgi:hypothetical protein